MADMYEDPCSSPLPTSRPVPALESDDISHFLHHLLHSSTYPSSSMSDKGKQLHPFSSYPLPPPSSSSSSQIRSTTGFCNTHPLPGDRHRPSLSFREGTSTADSSALVDSSSGLILSSSGVYFPASMKDITGNLSSSVAAAVSDAITASVNRKFPSENDLDDYDCESEEGLDASDGLTKADLPRTSSKRSRAAEVHNLSEKRRRSRINEKMKALQKLIPNSNKTDKASMLDEAIEYLKQLQLQVQMLSMRNELSLHPMYVRGVMQPMQLPEIRMALDGGYGSLHMNNGTGTPALDQETSKQTVFGLSNRYTPAHQPIGISTMTNFTNLKASFGLESSIQGHLGPFQQAATSSEVICREDIVAQQQLGRSGRNPTATLPFDTQACALEDGDSLEAWMPHRERSQCMLNNVDSNQVLFPHLNCLQMGRNMPNLDIQMKRPDC